MSSTPTPNPSCGHVCPVINSECVSITGFTVDGGSTEGGWGARFTVEIAPAMNTYGTLQSCSDDLTVEETELSGDIQASYKSMGSIREARPDICVYALPSGSCTPFRTSTALRTPTAKPTSNEANISKIISPGYDDSCGVFDFVCYWDRSGGAWRGILGLLYAIAIIAMVLILLCICGPMINILLSCCSLIIPRGRRSNAIYPYTAQRGVTDLGAPNNREPPERLKRPTDIG